jgi:hypothetical protein
VHVMSTIQRMGLLGHDSIISTRCV